MRINELHESSAASNDHDAAHLREELKTKGQFLVHLMSSPGSGKTTLLARLIHDLKDKVPIGIIELDIASDPDTSTMTRALVSSEEDRPSLLFLENADSRIRPAELDIGAHCDIMILGVPEGDDKPLKNPFMIQHCNAVIINKIDTLPYYHFNLDTAVKRIRSLNPDIPVFPVSAWTGEGMEVLKDWLMKEWQKFLENA